MSFRESRGNAGADSPDILQNKGPLLIQGLLQASPIVECHHKIRTRRPMLDHIDWQYVRVVDRGSGPRFAQKSFPRILQC